MENRFKSDLLFSYEQHEVTMEEKQERGAGRPPCSAWSGEICPMSGEWEIIGTTSTTGVFAKGKVMPFHYGKKVLWMLIRPG